MAQFPTNPTVGQVHTEYGVTYVYNGRGWSSSWSTLVESSGRITASDITPTTPDCGALWFDTIVNQLKEYDCATSQWNVKKTVVYGEEVYSLMSNYSAINEGQELVFYVNTVNVADGTEVPYVISGIDANDITAGSLTGTVTINQGFASVAITLKNDLATEGTEIATFDLPGKNASITVSILDTSKINYTFAASAASVDEGSTVTFTLTATGDITGNTFNYSITGIDASDIAEQLTGTFTGSGTTASFTINVVADQLTEGLETMTVSVTDAATLNIGTLSVDISDTSVAPPPRASDMLIRVVVPAGKESLSFRYYKAVYTDTVPSRSVQIDWGDGSAVQTVSATNTTAVTVSHTFAAAGTYDISFTGSGCLTLGYFVNDSSGLITYEWDVLHWGSFLHTDMFATFGNCTLVPQVLTATDYPIFATDYTSPSLYQTFAASNVNDPTISTWDVSSVTNFSAAFSNSIKFNQPLDQWNVSNGTNFAAMFAGAKEFNQPLNSWDVSKSTSFQQTFSSTVKFNQPLDQWNVSGVTNNTGFRYMFQSAQAFDQDLSMWNVSNCIGYPADFCSFNTVWTQPRPFFNVTGFAGWNGSLYPDATYPTYSPGARVYKIVTTTASQLIRFYSSSPSGGNKYLIHWGDGKWEEALESTSNVIHTYTDPGTYYVEFHAHSGSMQAATETVDLVQWGATPHLTYGNTFTYATNLTSTSATDLPVFNNGVATLGLQNIFYNSKLTNVTNIENWNVTGVKNFSNAFQYSAGFNQDISAWDTSAATNMNGMFTNCTVFNQDLSGWCVPLIATTPSNFSTNATAWTLPKPVWGTCP